MQFSSTPIQYHYSPRHYSGRNKLICSQKVKEFTDLQRIKEVSPEPGHQFLSHIFPVPKKTLGEFRVIFDLTELNKFIRKVRFQMDSLQDIMDLIRPGDYFISIDLSDAYFCIAMHVRSMPYLTFVFMNVYYQFTCLPQGLTSAPRIFTKVMRAVLSFLRSRGIRIAAWIDDFFVASSSQDLCREHAFRTVRTFQELGFLPNVSKSQLSPTQRIHHLGLIWDSVEFSVSVPEDKIASVRNKCLKAVSCKVSVRFLSSVLGSIEFFRWGFPYAAVHYRHLQRFVNYCLDVRGLSYDDKVFASPSALLDLIWWSKVGDTLPSRLLSPFYSDVDLTTDASDSGWGAWTSDGREAFGAWSDEEASFSINVREMLAVFFGLQCFFRSVSDIGVYIRSDNTTVVAYLKNQGGPKEKLCDVALELWNFCISRDIRIQASYLSGRKNVVADALSRVAHVEHSYELTDECFEALCGRLPFDLEIDCFASRLDHKLSHFYSRYSDPLSSHVDAFTIVWRDNVYLFPPIPIIDRVLSKFISDSTRRGLLICPLWPSQPWFPSLLDLLIAPPILLPSGSVVDRDHRLPRNCVQVGWIIGSDPVLRREYLGRLEFLGSGQSTERPLCLTKDVGEGSVLGLIHGLHVVAELL